MQYVDARSGVGPRAESSRAGATLESWDGEPPTAIETPTTSELFEDLTQQLAGADVLRVFEREWLTGENFGRRVEACFEAFQRRGGRIEYGDGVEHE